MSVVCTARSALVLFLSFSLTCVAQPGTPQYLTAQRTQRGPEQNPAAAAAAGKASVNFPPDRDDPVALQCDQLADHPLDALRVGDGVAFAQIQVDQALPVCQQAAESQPARPRYQYLYGRVLSAAKRYEEAAAQYTAADHAGYGFASLGLAGLYTGGAGVPKNLGEAQRFYFRAGNAGIADAFANGGELYFQENPPNYFQEKSWFEQAVQGGSAQGMADLGWLYESGNGVTKDAAKALSLFTQAANGGSAEGMYRMGMAYQQGLGVPKDPAAACTWFVRAAMSNDAEGEEQAGYCYYNGTGVAQDHQAAFQWFAKAGQAGLLDGQLNAADMLERGDGWNQDSASAVLWYQVAANQGNAYAMTQLGAHLRLGKGIAWSEAQAMQWFAKAAQTGYVPAETSLAVGYLNGLGQDAGQGKQDYQQAAYWFNQAADQNDGYAQLNLGVMYENGWAVPQNLERAKQLYAAAAASSDPAVAKLGSQYFDDVPASAPPEGTPQRSVAGSSKDSSDFWDTVIVGALAVGAVALLTSGGSSSGNVSTPGLSSSDPPKEWDPNYGKNCTAEVQDWGLSHTEPVYCQY